MPTATRPGSRRWPANRSQSAIQRGTSAKIRATVPEGTVRSARTTEPLPNAISPVPTRSAANHCGRPMGSSSASRRRAVTANSTAPAITKRVPAAIRGGRVSFVTRIPR